jgi:hypothetical protein
MEFKIPYRSLHNILIKAGKLLPQSRPIFDEIRRIAYNIYLHSEGLITDEVLGEAVNMDLYDRRKVDQEMVVAMFQLMAEVGVKEKNLMATLSQKLDIEIEDVELCLYQNIDFAKMPLLTLAELDRHLSQSDLQFITCKELCDLMRPILHNQLFLQALYAAHNAHKYSYKNKQRDRGHENCEADCECQMEWAF